MEDSRSSTSVIGGWGRRARTVRIDLQPFSPSSARPTRLGLLTTPLRDRFGLPVGLEFYLQDPRLDRIVARGAALMGIDADPRHARDRPAYGARAPPARRAAPAPVSVDFARWWRADGRRDDATSPTVRYTRLGVQSPSGLDGADRAATSGLIAEAFTGWPGVGGSRRLAAAPFRRPRRPSRR